MQISALPEIGTGHAPVPQSRRMESAAADFESLLIAQMLKSVRESSAIQVEDGEPDESRSSLLEMGEQQFAQCLAAAGGLGIAKMVLAGLSEHADR